MPRLHATYAIVKILTQNSCFSCDTGPLTSEMQTTKVCRYAERNDSRHREICALCNFIPSRFVNRPISGQPNFKQSAHKMLWFTNTQHRTVMTVCVEVVWCVCARAHAATFSTLSVRMAHRTNYGHKTRRTLHTIFNARFPNFSDGGGTHSYKHTENWGERNWKCIYG